MDNGNEIITKATLLSAIREASSGEAVAFAGLVLLHRELTTHGEVRLERSDFESHMTGLREGIQFDMDGDTIVLKHVKAPQDA